MEVARMLAVSAVLVAVVASRRAVDEICDAVVLVGGGDLLVSSGRVAVDAGEAGVVRGNLVAVVADGAVMRNGEIGVIECGVEPACCGVAGIAGGGETGGKMVGDDAAESLCAVPVGLVAAVARGVCGGEGIIIVHMTVGAGCDCGTGRGRHLVRAGERPSGGAVVKLAVGPGDGVVAGGAERSGELCGNVVGYEAAKSLCAGPIGSVAAVAVSVGGGEVVIIADMAEGARGGGMGAGEGKARDAVIEGGGGPGCGVVALRTIDGGEGGASLWVGRGIGLLPCSEVAAGVPAIGRSDLKIVVVIDVATSAGNIRVARG